MAVDEKIKITIGSEADTSGFQRMSRATTMIGSAGKRAKEAIGELSADLVAMGGPVAEVVKGFENMSKSMEAYGKAGILIGVAKIAIEQYAAYAKRLEERLKKASEEMKKLADERMNAAVARHLSESEMAVAALANGAAKTREEFLKMEAAAARLDAIVSRTAVAQGRGSLVDIQIEKVNAMIAAEDDASRKLVAAQYDLTLAKQKATNVENENARKVMLAGDKVEAQQKSAELARQATIDAEQALAKAQEKLTLMRESGAAEYRKTNEFEKHVQTATAALEKARQAEAKASEDLQAAELERTLTMEETTTAGKQAQLELLQATDNLKTLEEETAEALAQEAEASRKAAEATAKRAEFEQEVADLTATTKQHYEDRNAAMEDELNEVNEKIADAEESRKTQNAGMATDHAVSNFGGRTYNYQVDENGNINDFVDWQRAKRYGQRAARDAASADKANAAAERKAANLQDKLDKGRKLSDQDKKWLDDWNEFQNQQNQKDLEKRRDELQEAIKANSDAMRQDLSEIKNDLAEAMEIR